MQFCRKFSFVAITRFLGGHFWPKFGGGGHKNISVDWAEGAVLVEGAEGAEGLRRL